MSTVQWNGHGKLSLKSILAGVALVAASTVSTILLIDNRVRAETEQTAKVMEATHKALDARVTTLEKRFDRFDQKLDAVMDTLDVPASKRPPPMDGGR